MKKRNENVGIWYLPISMHKAMNSIPNMGQKRKRKRTKTKTQKYLLPLK